MSSDAATDKWYQGYAHWDYENGEPKASSSANRRAEARRFATMIWKGVNFEEGTTHKVGFGIKCGYALAWYCPTRPMPDTTVKEYQENVCKPDGSCVDPAYLCTRDGYDHCYNTMALNAHNEKRALHCADPMTGDTDMAIAMQTMLNDKQAATDPASRPVDYKDCLESFYEAPAGTSDEDVRDKNLATDAWYAEKAKYNFGTGVGSPKAEADVFSRIVWNISDGKVAFARRGSFVMAWYCPSGTTGINVGDASAYLAKIKPDTCEKPCLDDLVSDGYSKCYQPKGLEAHNAKRRIHRVPDLELDIDVAKRAQDLADSLAVSADGTMTVPSTEGCGWNKALADDATEAAKETWATDFWY